MLPHRLRTNLLPDLCCLPPKTINYIGSLQCAGSNTHLLERFRDEKIGAMMPNWCTNNITITGDADELLTLRSTVLVTEDDVVCFDFKKIIPKPPIIEQTEASSTVDRGREILLGQRPDDGFSEEFPDGLEKARVSLQAEQETGFKDWYDWSNANWGTKWNSCYYVEQSFGGTHWSFSFDTAWSPPEPIFDALAAQYPKCEFEIRCHEDACQFSGSGFYSNGEGHIVYSDCDCDHSEDELDEQTAELGTQEAMGDLWQAAKALAPDDECRAIADRALADLMQGGEQ